LRYEGISPYLVSGCLQTRYLLAQFVSIRISFPEPAILGKETKALG
jgi:hypothetical protein